MVPESNLSMTDSMPNTMSVLLMLGRLDGKMDAMMAHKQEQQEQIDKIDARVSTLEKGKAWVMGALALASLIASIVGLVFSLFSEQLAKVFTS